MTQTTEPVKENLQPEAVPAPTASPETPRITRLGDLLAEFDAFAEKLETAKATGRPMGPVTGIDRLDDILCGCLHPGLHGVAAGSGIGKTAFCLQVACSCQCPAVYVSCELSAVELLRRITARVTGTDLAVLKYPKQAIPASHAKALVRKAVVTAPDLVLIDATTAPAGHQWIYDQAERLREATESEHVLVVIDSLHSWSSGVWSGYEEYERLTHAIAALRNLAGSLRGPVLYITEQSKESNKQAERNNAPGTSAPAGNRVIEYQSESLIVLTAKMDKGKPIKDAYGDCDVTANVVKNRHNAPGMDISLKFTGKHQKFWDPTAQSREG